MLILILHITTITMIICFLILLMMEGVSPRKVERVDLVRWVRAVFHATGSTRAHYY